MNRQDQIFEYAFGEMSAQDAQVFEASLLNDIEAQKEINVLKGLRSDFGLLSDVPEMQFSKERLRNAILDQGMQPRKRPGINWLQWLMAPTALAAVVALTFVVTRNGSFQDMSSVTTAMLDGDKIGSTSTNELSDPGFGKELSVPTPPVGDRTPVVTNTAVKEKAEPTKRIRRPRRSSSQPLVATNTVPIRSGGVVVAFGSGSPSETLSSTAAMKSGGLGAPVGIMDARDIAVDDRTIIVIDKEQESGVGAVVATEVSVSQDVIIGG